MTFKSILVTARGGPETLQVVENDLRPPSAGEARIQVQAAPVVQDDIEIRRGNRPFLRKPPYVPGYAALGVVDAIGAGVTRVQVGERVAALTSYGGHTEVLYWPADQLVRVPDHLDAAEAVVLILNYLVPMQVMHAVVRVQPGDKVLVVGASGGVGTAFLELGRLAGLKMYGIASAAKAEILEHYGAVPIDYHSQDFVAVLRELEPGGLDYVFNGMGPEYFRPGLKVLRRGGRLVHYGGPRSFASFLSLVVQLIGYSIFPNGKRIIGFGTHTGDIVQFEPDWQALFRLLETGQIQPVIAQKFSLFEAARANALLESGTVVGNLVLLQPDLV